MGPKLICKNQSSVGLVILHMHKHCIYRVGLERDLPKEAFDLGIVPGTCCKFSQNSSEVTIVGFWDGHRVPLALFAN